MLTLEGQVKTGQKIGKKLGFATINIGVPRSVKKDQWGIYFSFIKIGTKVYPSVTHLGPPKTFSISNATCESHILNLKNNLYGKKVTKRLILKFREIEKFSNVRKLKKQIKKDVEQAKKFFGL